MTFIPHTVSQEWKQIPRVFVVEQQTANPNSFSHNPRCVFF